MSDEQPKNSHYEQLGGREAVMAISTAFYNAMERDEPALAALHALDADGRVSLQARERFGLFLVGWLGGPDDYHRTHGHPRLRMRHGAVAVNLAMRDAWLRCMQTALDECAVAGPVRAVLDARFAEVADFLRNTPD